MNEETLSLSYAENILTAVLRGELDHHVVVTIRGKIDDELYAKRPKALIIDIGHVDFMDSSGLGLIMGRLAKASELGIGVFVANPSPRAVRMLKMANLDRLIKHERKHNDEKTDQ